jgi:hypothetical protein
MASTRSSTTTQRDTARQVSTDTPKAALITLAQRGARIQIAGGTAAAKTLTGWAEAVDRLAQTVGDELLRRIDGKSDSPELAACLATAASSHLRELAALPRTAADSFDARLGRAPSTARRSR